MPNLPDETIEEMTDIFIGLIPAQYKTALPMVKRMIAAELKKTPHSEMKQHMIEFAGWITESILPYLDDDEKIKHRTAIRYIADKFYGAG